MADLPRVRPPSQKAQKFAQRFIETGNGTQAALDAGYAKRNRRNAARRATKLLKIPFIQRMIADANSRALLRAGATKEETIRDLRCVAFADIADAFDENGKLRPFSEMPERIRRAIAGVEVEELFEGHGEDREQVGVVRKVRLSDKNAALDKLAKILALYAPEKHELEHRGFTLEQLVPKRSSLDERLVPSKEEPQDG